MWQLMLLVLSVMATGWSSVRFQVVVSPQVDAARGDDAVLSCSFTHQPDYSGNITVHWLAREKSSPPFFSCSVRNNSAPQGRSDCLSPKLRYSLAGDPRRGELSLRIRAAQLTDGGSYFCRVELDKQKSRTKETQLQVTAEPRVLRLVETDSVPRSLECEVEGNPLPKLVWLSGSKLADDQGKTSRPGQFRLIGVVPYPEEEELTCRAENKLGDDQRTYPTTQPLMITALVCGLMGALLLLLLVGVIARCRRTRAPLDSSPVYVNADVVEKHRASEAPADGDGAAEGQLLYSAVGPPAVPQLRSSRTPPEPGVLYSTVNLQQQV